mmetsp:Transcript_33804/g.107344  ORF Transcript_33804/g.107344 Transcript_33804/m.107344 type:complete len:266 (+) Transcript_33804:912-1709(+)
MRPVQASVPRRAASEALCLLQQEQAQSTAHCSKGPLHNRILCSLNPYGNVRRHLVFLRPSSYVRQAPTWLCPHLSLLLHSEHDSSRVLGGLECTKSNTLKVLQHGLPGPRGDQTAPQLRGSKPVLQKHTPQVRPLKHIKQLSFAHGHSGSSTLPPASGPAARGARHLAACRASLGALGRCHGAVGTAPLWHRQRMLAKMRGQSRRSAPPSTPVTRSFWTSPNFSHGRNPIQACHARSDQVILVCFFECDVATAMQCSRPILRVCA